jgi:hypothetical protein
MVTITDEVLGTNCNEFTILIAGTEDWETSLAATAVSENWSDDLITYFTEYSDGYHLTATQTIATTPLSDGPTFQGMCFAIDDPDTADAVLGAFCIAYTSLDVETENASVDSLTVSYVSPSEWDGNYDSTVGE